MRTVWWLALGLVGLGTLSASADYLVLKIDVNKIALVPPGKTEKGSGDGIPGVPPGLTPPGVPGGGSPPGGVPLGTPPGIYPGGGTPPGVPPGFRPGGIPPGFRPGGGRGGIPGSQPGSGSPGIPQGSYPPSGTFLGSPGGIPQQPGIPPGTIPGMPGFPGVPGTQPVEGPLPPLWVYAIVEVHESKQVNNKLFSKGITYYEHKWGKSFFLSDLPWASITRWRTLSPAQRFADKQQELQRHSKVGVEDWLRLAEWALEHRLLAEFEAAMQEAIKLDAKHPRLAAYLQVRQALSKPPTAEDPAAREVLQYYRGQGYRAHVSPGQHYLLLTRLQEDSTLKRRLKRLEENYHLFFYWFALKGQALPVPTYQLVAVIPGATEHAERSRDDFLTEQQRWGVRGGVEEEGFTLRRDNVAFLAPQPLGEGYRKLYTTTKSLCESKGITPVELLREELWQRYQKGRIRVWPYELIEMQMLMLAEKALEEEAELTVLTRESVRQLLAATGLLPRTVVAGEWLRSGLASFFHSSRFALYPTAGVAEWEHLVHFKDLIKSGKLSRSQAGELLLQVVSDTYFHKAYAQIREDKGELSPRGQEELQLAQTTAWALTYYLMKERLPQLMNYLAELRSLPRDVAYSAPVLQRCFGRAFGLKHLEPEAEDVQQLAQSWFAAVENTWLDYQDFERWAREERAKATAETISATPK